MANLESTFEDDSDDKKTVKSEDDDKIKDFELELHIKKHKAELDHKRQLEMDKHSHQLTKIGILLPSCGIIVFAILGTFIYYHMKIKKQVNNENGKIKGIKCNDDGLKIPKAKVNDFRELMMMGFEKRKIVKALCETESLDNALDLLTRETMSSKTQRAKDTLGRNPDEIVEITMQDEQISIKDQDDFVYLGTF